jgi:hypothetical protein
VEILSWLEATALAVWVRESTSLFAYPSIIALHAIGLGFLVGANAVIDLRLLGFAPSLPLRSMEAFFAVAWTGFAVNALSGTLLLMASARAMFANPFFLAKLLLIALAVLNLILLEKHVFGKRSGIESGAVPPYGKLLAWTSLVLWTGAIVAGRLTAYVLMTGVST